LKTFAVLFLLAGVVLGETALPRPSGYVNDFAGVLPDASRQKLTANIAALKSRSGIEMAVVTVSSLGDASIEEYANRLFNQWGIGQKGKDNGVLVLVAPNDRQMRIEVGYDLEGIVPDGLAGQLIREDFTPSFKAGDYPRGIEQGVDHLILLLDKGETLPKDWAPPSERTEGSVAEFIGMVLFFSLFVGIGFFALGIGVKNRNGFGLMWGAGFGGIPLLMSFLFVHLMAPSTIPFRLFVLPVVALAAFVFGLVVHRTRLYTWWSKLPKGSGGSSSSGGWSSGGGSSSSSSGGGFSGGSSGGGGASGRW